MAKKVAEKNVAEEVKAVVAEEAVAAPAAEVKAEPKKRGRKPAAKTEEKKETKATKKTADKNAEAVYVQYAGFEFSVDEIKDRAKAAYEAEGHKASSIKSLRLYIKPEEMKAYYVINDKAAGSIEL